MAQRIEAKMSASNSPDMELLDRTETARLLRTSLRTLDKLQIPSVRIGRRKFFRPADIDDYLERQMEAAAAPVEDEIAATVRDLYCIDTTEFADTIQKDLLHVVSRYHDPQRSIVTFAKIISRIAASIWLDIYIAKLFRDTPENWRRILHETENLKDWLTPLFEASDEFRETGAGQLLQEAFDAIAEALRRMKATRA